MDKIRNSTLATMVLVFFSQVIFAQYNTWDGLPRKEDAINAHSIYRQALKTKDWQIAFENWQTAYELAPAADGKRDYHFIDGVKLYIHKFKNESDPAKKEEYKHIINRLYDEAIEAYDTGAVVPSKCKGNPQCITQKKGYVLGRKGYDMFYTLNSPYSENLEVFLKSVELAGNESEYIVFDPIFAMLTYQYQNNRISKEEVLDIYKQLEDIANYNIENNTQYGQYYEQAWAAAKAKLAPIDTELFDCDYFLPKYREMYEEDPENYENVKTVLALLKQKGCPDNQPFVAMLDEKWQKYAEEQNALIQAEFEANNPSVAAKRLYDEGKYRKALEKYDEAIAKEEDAEKKAGYLFSQASILFRKLDQYSSARSKAYEAANLRPGWGRPYMLIGDMYASSARSCGDGWNQRLAIIAAIDKYSHAKSLDQEVAEEAQGRISKYYSSLPQIADGHMRGVNEGDQEQVGCWIGETVKVRFQ